MCSILTFISYNQQIFSFVLIVGLGHNPVSNALTNKKNMVLENHRTIRTINQNEANLLTYLCGEYDGNPTITIVNVSDGNL